MLYDNMLHNYESVFETIYSLPAIAHSVAISTRTPTAGYQQASKFMPEFGGVLDIPGTSLKNNSLSYGPPFQPKASFHLVQRHDSSADTSSPSKYAPDCLVVSKYLESCGDNQFSTFTSQGETLFFDSICEICDHDTSNKIYVSTPYAKRTYSERIRGIKRQQDFLLIKFKRDYHTIQLNKSFLIDRNDAGSIEQQQALQFVASTRVRRARDACLNKFNSSLQAVGVSSSAENKVKLYDLSKDQRTPIHTVSWNSHERDITLSVITVHDHKRRVIRTFTSSEDKRISGIQQLDHLPSHLINMIVTTSDQTCLVDPRQENIAQVYVDKSKMPSFYPIELTRRTEFSRHNHHQFYSLTNVHLRVFDTRYYAVPMNQMNHMLDSNSLDTLNLKLVSHRESKKETLCCSSSGELCLMTMDLTKIGNLINPRTVHLPFIEPSPNNFLNDEDTKLLGLDVIANEADNLDEGLFKALQLTVNGDICLRNFIPSHEDCDMNNNHENPINDIIQSDKRISMTHFDEDTDGFDLNTAAIRNLRTDVVNNEFLNILESDNLVDLNNRLKSKRAIERFEKMKNKLDAL